MALTFTYRLGEYGWAEAHLSDEVHTLVGTVSYLHDTVTNIVEAALSLLLDPATPQRIVFMDEPGELQLLLTPATDGSVDVVLRWYDDWESWGMHPEYQFKLVWETTTNAVNFAQIVKKVLDDLWMKYGAEHYKARWLEHDFPISLHEKLNCILAE
ncbi:hypothetical protein [uncultured Hymenobacter sp.]|uniref:hypothetical protein n=1 Tax=uncultured Hymenobacter sp. TaxID=170016 RepID=UPI0035CB9862